MDGDYEMSGADEAMEDDEDVYNDRDVVPDSEEEDGEDLIENME